MWPSYQRGSDLRSPKGRAWVGASPALLMWSRRRQLKRRWDKASKEGAWLSRIRSRVLERSSGCWLLLQLLKRFAWESCWITNRDRNSSLSWDQNSWGRSQPAKDSRWEWEQGSCFLVLQPFQHRHLQTLLSPHPTDRLLYKILSLPCFPVLLQRCFCDPEHACAQDQCVQITPMRSKTCPNTESCRQPFVRPHSEADWWTDPAENESCYKEVEFMGASTRRKVHLGVRSRRKGWEGLN